MTFKDSEDSQIWCILNEMTFVVEKYFTHTQNKWVMLLWIGLSLWIIWCFCKVLKFCFFFLTFWSSQSLDCKKRTNASANFTQHKHFFICYMTGHREKNHQKKIFFFGFLYCLLFDRYVRLESVLWDIK